MNYYARIDVNLVNSGKGPTTPKEPRERGVRPPRPPRPKKEIKEKNYDLIAVKSTGAMALTIAGVANSAVGSYTGNKVRQNNVKAGIGIASLGLVALTNPISAAVVASSYAIKRGIDMSVEHINAKEQANYNRSYLGNMTTSGSRWKGGL